MTDDEYTELLKALAGKHLRLAFLNAGNYAIYLQHMLHKFFLTYRLLKVVEEIYIIDYWNIRNDQENCSDHDCLVKSLLMSSLFSRLEGGKSVIETGRRMEQVGILDALNDAPELVFGGFRRSVIPIEDIELLRGAGYSDHEIEVLKPNW